MVTKRKINLASRINMSPRQRTARLNRVASAAVKTWRSLSSSLGARYRLPYNAAMRVTVKPSQGTISLSLSTSGAQGKLVRSIEYGYGPGGFGTSGAYDMRRTLLKSSSTKLGRNGRYLAVPIGKTTRTIISHGGNTAYAMARRLDASLMTQTGTKWGGRLPNPSRLAAKIHSRARHVPGIGHVPPHATDPLANLYRFKRPGSRGSKYGIFRTISANGKPWVHPGIKARRFMRKVAKLLPEIAKAVV